jgi:predicted permease
MLFGLERDVRAQLLLFAVLPPAVLNFMVAELYQQEPAKVASIVMLGNVAAIVFVPIGLTLGLS